MGSEFRPDHWIFRRGRRHFKFVPQLYLAPPIPPPPPHTHTHMPLFGVGAVCTRGEFGSVKAASVPYRCGGRSIPGRSDAGAASVRRQRGPTVRPRLRRARSKARLTISWCAYAGCARRRRRGKRLSACCARFHARACALRVRGEWGGTGVQNSSLPQPRCSARHTSLRGSPAPVRLPAIHRHGGHSAPGNVPPGPCICSGPESRSVQGGAVPDRQHGGAG